MGKYRKFYISFIIFILIFFLIDNFLGDILFTSNIKEVNLKVMLIFIYAIYMWTAQVLPNAYISIFIITLIAVLKLESFSKVISYTFGSTVFIFLFSISIISYAFKQSGLADRMSQGLLNRFGGNNKKTLFSLMFTSYILSMFLTAIAGVSISLPIASKIISKNQLKKGDKFAKACMLGITYGGLIGGVATPLGTPVNLLMMKYLNELGKYELTFLHWILIGIPLSFMLLFISYFILCTMLKIKVETLVIETTKTFPLSNKEKKSILAFCIIVVLFMLSQFFEDNIWFMSLNLNIISVICSLMLFLPPFEIIEWKDSLRNMDWESLIFLVGSIALGYILYNTETATVIAKIFFEITGVANLYALVFIFCAFTIVMHILLSSNTVTGTVIVPILISFAQQLGVSPWYVTAPAIYSISLAFILPTESPTNIITYNTGYYDLRDMLKIGTVLTIACIILISSFLIIYGKITGLYTIG